MNSDEIERTAMKDARSGAPDPPEDMLDAFLYLYLFQLYALVFEGRVTREQARPFKLTAVSQYSEKRKLYDFREQLRLDAVKLWKDIEDAASDYMHDKTIENADKLYSVIYNLRR